MTGSDWDPLAIGYVPFALGRAGFGQSFGPAFRNQPEWSLCFRVDERHSNPIGTCHGGALATFADSQLLAMPHHTGDPSKHTPTVSLSMDYLAPASVGQWVVARVELLRTTRALIFTQAVLRVDGQPVARSNAVYRNNERTGYALG